MDLGIYLVLALLFTTFFSGMEVAFVSVDKLRFEVERKEGLSSRILTYFFQHAKDFVSMLLTGYSIALVVYGLLMAQLTGDWLQARGIFDPFLLIFLQ